jgi:serine/threonine-protein kinase
VTYLAVTSLRQTGPTSAAASVAVTTSGPGPVTLTVSWYSMDGKGTRTPEGRRTFQLSGQTQYTRELPDLSFQNGGCYWYWGVLASTEPASPRVASQQIPTLCDLR